MIKSPNSTDGSGELVPVEGEALPAVWRASTGVDAEPDYMVSRPPYNPDSAIEVIWSNVMVWPRRGVKGFMWLTLHWWRTAIACGTVLLIWLVVH